MPYSTADQTRGERNGKLVADVFCALLLATFPWSSSVGSAVWPPSLSSKVACSQSIGWFLARTMRQALFVELTEWTVL